MNFYNSFIAPPRESCLHKFIRHYKKYKEKLKELGYPTNDKKENKRLKKLAWNTVKLEEYRRPVIGCW